VSFFGLGNERSKACFGSWIAHSRRVVSRLDDEARAELAAIEEQHRLRTPRVVDSAQGPRITLDGVEVLNFGSNDYLSLANDPRLIRAAVAAVEESGVGAGASRLIVGNHREHAALEISIADWLRVPASRFFNTGYAANVSVLTTLCGPTTGLFSDELNHASIIDGCRLSRAELHVFPHGNLAALEERLRAFRATSNARAVIVSETLFSMDGDVADVRALAELARRHDAVLVLDEAHAIGAWGPEGRGIAASVGVAPDVLIGTCGKALGSFGAFAATSKAIAELLWNKARPLVFSTGLPPMVVAATRAAIDVVRSSEGDERRRRLASHARVLRSLVSGLAGATESAIAALIVGDDRRAMELSSLLLEARVLAQGIRPPTVAEGTARLRISLASGHSSEEVERLGSLLASHSSR